MPGYSVSSHSSSSVPASDWLKCTSCLSLLVVVVVEAVELIVVCVLFLFFQSVTKIKSTDCGVLLKHALII